MWQHYKVFHKALGPFVLRQLQLQCSGVTAFTPVHLERGRGRGAGERTEERNSRSRESEYNETARKTLREPLHHTVCQNHCRPSIDQQDGPPLQTGLVLFTEPRLVRPGKSHQHGKTFQWSGTRASSAESHLHNHLVYLFPFAHLFAADLKNSIFFNYEYKVAAYTAQ